MTSHRASIDGIEDRSDSVANALEAAIRDGDIKTLQSTLQENPKSAQIRIGHLASGLRTPLPGHFPNSVQTAQLLIEHGADVNAAFEGPNHSETPLHWAASCNDVALIETLLDAGADINATGGVLANGTPLTDARAFLQTEAAHELIRRGATVGLQDAATLGLLESVQSFYQSKVGGQLCNANISATNKETGNGQPSQDDTDTAFWNACHGGQLDIVIYLHEKGANINAIPSWDKLTPLEAARRSGAQDIMAWFKKIEAKST
ncbi:ankyrin [Xylariaceae sp. FL1019]|nr:ankyrin [Xylariaceae sp. FL1019]